MDNFRTHPTLCQGEGILEQTLQSKCRQSRVHATHRPALNTIVHVNGKPVRRPWGPRRLRGQSPESMSSPTQTSGVTTTPRRKLCQVLVVPGWRQRVWGLGCPLCICPGLPDKLSGQMTCVSAANEFKLPNMVAIVLGIGHCQPIAGGNWLHNRCLARYICGRCSSKWWLCSSQGMYITLLMLSCCTENSVPMSYRAPKLCLLLDIRLPRQRQAVPGSMHVTPHLSPPGSRQPLIPALCQPSLAKELLGSLSLEDGHLWRSHHLCASVVGAGCLLELGSTCQRSNSCRLSRPALSPRLHQELCLPGNVSSNSMTPL